MKILIGPKRSWAGSHNAMTLNMPGAAYFEGTDLLAQVEKHKPDVVLLKASGHNRIDLDEIMQCPVPVIGLYHDWVCWGSERLEAVSRTVDWLITEKSAYEYLINMGIKNCSTYLLMSKQGVERVQEAGIEAEKEKVYDAAFLGSFFVEGYKNLLRFNENDPINVIDNVYWARLGFKNRTKIVHKLATYDGKVMIAANSVPKGRDVKEIWGKNNPSFAIVARSRINVHSEDGRKHAANRCFETMAIGTLLFCEEGNELFDYVPEGLVIPYTLENLHEKIRYYHDHPEEAEDIAQKAKAYALEHFTNDKLVAGLKAHIEERMEAITTSFKARNMSWDDFRAPIHWEGDSTDFHDEFLRLLVKHDDTAIGANERGWFEFERYLKGLNGKHSLIERYKRLYRALHFFNQSICKDPTNITPRWNRAVVFWAMGLKPIAKMGLREAKQMLLSGDFTYPGSRLEMKIDWWMSGHIEHELALAKITGDHRELEKKAFLYRIGMVLGDKEIYWPELPDEHKRNGDMARVLEIDPLEVVTDEIKQRIYDYSQQL